MQSIKKCKFLTEVDGILSALGEMPPRVCNQVCGLCNSIAINLMQITLLGLDITRPNLHPSTHNRCLLGGKRLSSPCEVYNETVFKCVFKRSVHQNSPPRVVIRQICGASGSANSPLVLNQVSGSLLTYSPQVNKGAT